MAGLVFEGVAARILGVIFGVYAVILLFASKSWTSLFFTEDLILGTAAEFFLRVMLVGSILSLCICCLAFPESVGVRRSVLILCVLMLIQYSLTLAYGENIHSNMFKLQFCGVLLYFLLALYWNIEGGDNPFKFGTNKCQDLSKTWPTLLMAANFLVYGILMSFFTCRFYSLHWEEEMKVWDLTWFYGLHSGLFFLAMGIGGLLDYSSSDGTKRMYLIVYLFLTPALANYTVGHYSGFKTTGIYAEIVVSFILLAISIYDNWDLFQSFGCFTDKEPLIGEYKKIED